MRNAWREDLIHRVQQTCWRRESEGLQAESVFIHHTYNPHVPSLPCPCEHSMCGMQCYLCSYSLLQDTTPRQRWFTCLDKALDSIHTPSMCTSLAYTPLCCPRPHSDMLVQSALRVPGAPHKTWERKTLLATSVPYTMSSTWWEINKYLLNTHMSSLGYSSIFKHGQIHLFRNSTQHVLIQLVRKQSDIVRDLESVKASVIQHSLLLGDKGLTAFTVS